MADRLSLVHGEHQVSVVLHDREGRPYTAVTAYRRDGYDEVGVHRRRGTGAGTGVSNCALLGGPCNFEVAEASLPSDRSSRVDALKTRLRQIHPTMMKGVR